MGKDGMQGEAYTPEDPNPQEIITSHLSRLIAAAEARMTEAEKEEEKRMWQEMAGTMLPEVEAMRETLDKLMDREKDR